MPAQAIAPAAPAAPPPLVAQDALPARWARDAAFIALHQGFRASGGLARSEAWSASPDNDGPPPYIALARQLVAGQVFSFHWHESIWVPRFQFEADGRGLRPAPGRVLAELGGVYDGWDLAGWYLHANDGLRGRRPIDLIEGDLDAVLAAARADRFAIDG